MHERRATLHISQFISGTEFTLYCYLREGIRGTDKRFTWMPYRPPHSTQAIEHIVGILTSAIDTQEREWRQAGHVSDG